ncbi:MAG: UDP-N-acetylmuramoyl-tripeptide--D-alanyl-D-alanine ligase, partial [Planktomarina sp.]
MTPLWISTDADAATGGTSSKPWMAYGVSIDTRTIQPGDIFVALKADRDGHDFAAMALEKGAAVALVTHRPDNVSTDAPLLVVDDVLTALEQLGQAARTRTNARILAVTGSVGKTSTKEMLRTVLTQQGNTHASVASYNNHWGVPLTLARMPADTEFGIFEIGMNHPGEIAPLSKMVQPHVAMITTIAPAHMEAFESIEGIAREKASICEGLLPNGAAVLPADVDTVDILVEAAKAAAATIIGFGTKAEAFRLTTLHIQDTSTIVQASIRNQPMMMKLNSAGRHFASNAMGVLAAVEALGGDPTRAALDMGRWQPPAGRGMREEVVLDTDQPELILHLIDDAYNANPTSMAAALEVLAAANPVDGIGRHSNGRRIAILGDMLELGDDEHAIHAALADNLHLQGVDVVHCVGPRMKSLYDALPDRQRGLWVEVAIDL